MLVSSDGEISPLNALCLYGLLVGVVVLALAGIFVVSLIAGWWGKRKALREGRY